MLKLQHKSIYREPLVLVGTLLIGLTIFMALVSFALPSPNEMNLEKRFLNPSWQHPFGLDQNGSDVFAQVFYGARVSLFVAFSVVLITHIVGLLIGSLAGYWGRWWDQTLMRFIDMIQAFPSFLLALALVAVLGPSIKNLIFAMCLTGWAGVARLVRGEVLHLKELDYVAASRATGASHFRTIMFYIWPNLVGPLLVNASFALAATIIAESGLSFLGLGAPANVPTWGSLLNSGRKVLIEAPHVSVFPGLAILFLILGFNLLGDGLRDHLDPRKS